MKYSRISGVFLVNFTDPPLFNQVKGQKYANSLSKKRTSLALKSQKIILCLNEKSVFSTSSLIWIQRVCAALIIHCELMTLIVCSLISKLTQKGILRAAKWTTGSERGAAAASALHPASLTNTHLSLRGKKNRAAMVTDSFSLSLHLRPQSSNMHSCSLTGRAFLNVLLHRILRDWIHCAAGVLLRVWIQLGLCSLCVCCACRCSPIRSRLCLKCLWYEVKGLAPAGTHEYITSQSMSATWQWNLIFSLWENGEVPPICLLSFYLFIFKPSCDLFPIWCILPNLYSTLVCAL